jgi:hypothetical protein
LALERIVVFQKLLFPVVVIEKAGRVSSEKLIREVERFDRGQPARGFTAIVLSAGIGGVVMGRKRPFFKKMGLLELPKHRVSIAPCAVDKKESQVGVFSGKRRSIESEQHIASKRGELFFGVGEKVKVRTGFQSAQTAFFQILSAMA